MIVRIAEAVVLTGLGLAMLKWSEPLARTFGVSNLAERYLGQGGTYTMWKLVGILFIVVAFLVLTGAFTFGIPSTIL